MRIIFSAIAFLFSSLIATAQPLPSRQEILKTLKLTNSYFMDKWPDAGKSIFTNIERPSNIWTRAVYYEGLVSLYKETHKKQYYDYMLQWGEKHKWGLRGGVQTRNADNQCCAQTYIDIYLMDGKKHPERIAAITECINGMKSSTKIDDWNWVDALQMAMPVFVKLGNLYRDSSYFERMYRMYAYTKNKHGEHGLFNPEDNLWWRDKDFDPPYVEPNGNNCYWSRGNGWVLAALARTMEELPPSDPHYDEYLEDFRNMCAALLPLQREDGFWNVSLQDPTHFGGRELSGTALFTFGFAWGVNHGVLDSKTYLPLIIKSWNAMVKDAVHPNGKLGYVQGTGKEPKDGQPVNYNSTPDFEDYGLGCLLLAGTEIIKLRK
jgi:unsaturated rhamnogalacturonyl hydrolase